MHIIGIDTSLRSTGVGIIAPKQGGWRLVECFTIKNKPQVPHSECLSHILSKLQISLGLYQPEAAAIEGGFFFKNAKTAMVLGEARGVVIAACATAGVPVYEYSPRSVKQSLTGAGAASKDQVCRMVMSMLGIEEKPQADAADALAIALCHCHSKTGIAALQNKPI